MNEKNITAVGKAFNTPAAPFLFCLAFSGIMGAAVWKAGELVGLGIEKNAEAIIKVSETLTAMEARMSRMEMMFMIHCPDNNEMKDGVFLSPDFKGNNAKLKVCTEKAKG